MPRHSRPERLVRIAEAAEYANLSKRTIQRYIHIGRITGYRVGPKLLNVDLDELDRITRPVSAAPPSA